MSLISRSRNTLRRAILLGLLSFGLASSSAARAATPGPDKPPSPSAAGPAAPTAPDPYRFQPGVICPLCELTPQFPLGRSGLHWHSHWRTAGMREYLTIAGLAAGVVTLRLFVPPATKASWTGPVLFDDSVRNALRIDSTSGRKTAGMISDGLFVWEVVHPSLIDPLLVAWWARESPFAAWQMLVIDAQAYAMTLFLNDVIKRAVSRERPWVDTEDCAQNPDGEACGSGGRYLSFYSGHAAVTATGAGLLCAHHTQLSLYQNALLDQGTCALAVAGTIVTGAMRIASDNHWTSDVLVGHLLGYTSGYLLPTLLYYKQFSTTPHEHEPPAPVYAALPTVTNDSLGLMVIGMF